MLVAFWKAATSFPDIFLFSKTFFFLFFLASFFICICCIMKIGVLVSCFFLLLLYFQKRVLFFHFLLSVSFAFVTFWKTSFLFLFFSFEISINNDLFFQGPLLTAAFSNGYQWGVFKIFGQQIGEKLLISPE